LKRHYNRTQFEIWFVCNVFEDALAKAGSIMPYFVIYKLKAAQKELFHVIN